MPYTAKRQLKYLVGGMILLTASGLPGASDSSMDISQQILELMIHAPGARSGYRPLHAKGAVCQGNFTPSADAPGISRAVHFGAATPVIVRFSDGAADPAIRDSSKFP